MWSSYTVPKENWLDKGRAGALPARKLSIWKECEAKGRLIWLEDTRDIQTETFLIIENQRLMKQATFEFQKPSLSKWGQVHNLSCENESYVHYSISKAEHLPSF